MLATTELVTIFDLQKKLDEKIEKNRNIKHDSDLTIKSRFLALLVEIGELANEFRCFKYWSYKPASAKDVLLEEYSDGLHFIISIATSLSLTANDCIYEKVFFDDLNTAFLALFTQTTLLEKKRTSKNLNIWLNIYYGIAYLAGFTGNDIFAAYLAKNKINHQRQEANY